MKIAVLFNCQGHGLAAALQAMLPDAEVDYFSLQQDAESAAIAAGLLAYDHVISAPVGRAAGKLSNRNVRRTVRHFVVLPALGFRAFYPDQTYVQHHGSALSGPTGHYHSRIAVAGFLAGLSVAETVALYNRLAFARLGYLDMYEAELSLVGERFAEHGLNAADMLARLRLGGCFMHSINHPKPAALVELALLACGAIGATPRAIAAESVPDFLRGHGAHPVFEEVAAAIGIAPEGMFHAGALHTAEFRPISTQDFVAGSFAAYENFDRADLRGVDGLAAALTALDLQEWPAKRPRRAPQQDVALMTWHGTLLRETPAGYFHLPLSVPATDAPWLRGDWRNGDAEEQLVIAGGMQARPAWRDGMVALADGPHYLTADGDSPQTWRARVAPGDSESFLPVTDSQLGVLLQLLGGAWAEAGAAEGRAAQIAPGPAVALGARRIDLIEAWPAILPAARDGAARLAVLLDGAPSVLRQTALPAETQPAARTIALGESMVLAGEDVFLPLPLTLNNAERRWLHTHCGHDEGLPWRIEAPRAVISRVRDRRLVGPPPPAGAPLPRDGALEGAIVLLEPAGSEGSGWMAPLLRLLVMAPFLTSDMAALALGRAADADALALAWDWAGLPAWPVVAPPVGLYTGRDVTWVDPAWPWGWPAETLHAARSILLRGAAAGPGRLFLRGPASAALLNGEALEGLGFEVLDMASPVGDQLPRLREAGLVVGVGEDLLATAFCPDGTKVVELCGDSFRPEAWMLSCALGMSHAVLPCAGFALDARRLELILEMLRYRR